MKIIAATVVLAAIITLSTAATTNRWPKPWEVKPTPASRLMGTKNHQRHDFDSSDMSYEIACCSPSEPQQPPSDPLQPPPSSPSESSPPFSSPAEPQQPPSEPLQPPPSSPSEPPPSLPLPPPPPPRELPAARWDPLLCSESMAATGECYGEVMSSYFQCTPLDPECCDVILTMDEHCDYFVGGMFYNPFFPIVLRKTCQITLQH